MQVLTIKCRHPKAFDFERPHHRHSFGGTDRRTQLMIQTEMRTKLQAADGYGVAAEGGRNGRQPSIWNSTGDETR
jgi:hypothetical protein